MKNTLLTFVAALVMTPLMVLADAPKNTKCPMMTDDDADEAEVVEMAGQKILLCCGKCTKAWDKNPKYFAKVGLELGLLPQLKGKEAELGLDKVTLLPQRYCAVNNKTVVSPECPTVEYKGQKVYVFNQKAVEKWNANPDEAAKKAIAAGVLPQLAGK
jgi:hypothetical protein